MKACRASILYFLALQQGQACAQAVFEADGLLVTGANVQGCGSEQASSLDELLFVMIVLGDDRLVERVVTAGA